MSKFSNKDFSAKLKEFRISTTGAACFYDGNKYRCVNGMTAEQAQQFADFQGLLLVSFKLGESCVANGCP